MRFFDLANFTEDGLGALGKRLGYEKIFTAGKDVELAGESGSGSRRKKIIRSDSAEAATKALKQNDFIGFMPQSVSVSRKVLDAIKNNEKLLFVPVSRVTCAEEGARAQGLAKARGLVRSAMMAKVSIAIVSLADSREELMSSLQMLEVAGFLGMDPARAKEALNALGGLL